MAVVGSLVLSFGATGGCAGINPEQLDLLLLAHLRVASYQSGSPLTKRVKMLQLAGKTAYSVANGVLFKTKGVTSLKTVAGIAV